MEPHKYLQQVEILSTIIEQKKEELRTLRAMTTSVGTFNYSEDKGFNGTVSRDAKFVKFSNEIIELEGEISTELIRLAKRRHIIIDQIQGLPNVKHVKILFKIYIEFKRYEDVADEMNLSVSHIKKLCAKALRSFEYTYLINDTK